MQIATLTYQYNPKENVNGDGRAKLRHRHVLTTVTNTQKKSKQRQSLQSKLSIHSNDILPSIKTDGQRRSSIRINGNSLTSSSKLGETSTNSVHHRLRSHSRQSIKSENPDAGSRSGSPAGTHRPPSKVHRVQFGYPIKLRSPDFYGPDKSDVELRLREGSFVNDSVRCAHQYRRSSIIPDYEAFDDPHLRRFFQSPIVLDIVRKTLSVEPNHSYKQNERLAKTSKIIQRSKSNGPYDSRNDDYLRIVSKGSSGYAKLNGYNCIPPHAPARHHRRRSSTSDPTTLSAHRWNTNASRTNHSRTQDKDQALTNTSVTSVPTNNSNQLQKQDKEKKTNRYEKSKQSKPIATSSSIRHPVRRSTEGTTSNNDLLSTTKTNGNVPEQKNESAVVSTVSQD